MDDVDTMTIPPPARGSVMGDNLPPREQQIRDEIMERHGHLIPRQKELLETVARIPEAIPEDEAGKVTDFIKAVTAHMKAINGARVAEKEPHLEASRIVDGIFKRLSEPLETAKKSIEARLGIVLRAREDRLRREAEDRARKEREEAEKRRQEAEERARKEREAAEEARRAAEEAEKKAKEAAEARQREREEHERKAREAEEQRRREAEETERKEKERLAQLEREREEAAERRRAAEAAAAESERQRDEELKAAKEAEARAKKAAEEAEAEAERNRRAAAKREREESERLERERKEADRKAREQQREAEEAARIAARDAKQAERSADHADKDLGKAVKAENTAEIKVEKVDNASPAEFARTRGDYGALATLSRHWTFANLDRDKIDLKKLRHFIPMDGLERAVRAFIESGGRELTGVDIFEDDKTSIR